MQKWSKFLKLVPTTLTLTGIISLPIFLTSCSKTENKIVPTEITIVGLDTLNGTLGTNGQSSYHVNVLPDDANQSVTWSLENNTQGDKISINQSGDLSWTDTLNANTYNFTIKATSDLDDSISATKNVSLTIFENQDPSPTSITINGQNNLTGIDRTSGSSQYSITVLPTNASTLVNWSLENNSSSAISIDNNGILSWSNQITEGTYNLVIKAVSAVDASISATKNVTLIVQLPQPTSITINGDSSLIGTTGTSGSSQYSVTTNPINASKGVIWSLNSDPSNGKINITQTGLLTWDDSIAQGSYSFRITATSNVASSVKSTKDISLQINAPINPVNSYELGAYLDAAMMYIPLTVDNVAGQKIINVNLSDMHSLVDWIYFTYLNDAGNSVIDNNFDDFTVSMSLLNPVEGVTTNETSNIFDINCLGSIEINDPFNINEDIVVTYKLTNTKDANFFGQGISFLEETVTIKIIH